MVGALSPSSELGTLLCWVDARLHKASCWKTEVSVACRGAGGAIFASAPEATPFQRVHPADFSTAATNESSAAQMDQPSPRDSITITINAAPAPRRGPIPCADRWGASNIQSIQYRVLAHRIMRSVLSIYNLLKR